MSVDDSQPRGTAYLCRCSKISKYRFLCQKRKRAHGPVEQLKQQLWDIF